MELTSQGTDNPEQRIEQDCDTFATQTLELTLDLLLQVHDARDLRGRALEPVGKLRAADLRRRGHPRLHDVGRACSMPWSDRWPRYVIGRPLVGINFVLERYNADFRYRMVRIRENAESIALYRGEADEERGLRGAFGRIYGDLVGST